MLLQILTLAALQSLPEYATRVDPLPGEEILNPCEYRLVIPAPERAVRAVWVIWDRGQDYLHWYQDAEVRGFAADFRLALLLAAHCRSKEREDMIVIPEKGVGRALFTALDQFAESERRPELHTVPLIHLGWSGAGSLVGRMAAYRPERYLAGIAYAPGQYDPLGMNTIDLPANAFRAPQLIVANGGDPVNGTRRPYDYFRRYFEGGAPWTFAVQNRTPHYCLQNAQRLILEWLRGVLRTTPKAWGKGQFGHVEADPSGTRDEWKQPVFNVRNARIDRRREGELPAGWMPSREFAREWLAFERRVEPPKVWKP